MISHHDMTFTALSKRADEVKILDTVDVMTGEGNDQREVVLFLEHDQRSLGEDCGYKTVAREVIAAALCDVDDWETDPEIISRDDLVAMFGADRVYGWEVVE
jgi:hypothetical protein